MSNTSFQDIEESGLVTPVYSRPIPAQYIGYVPEDDYDQFFTQNYWVQQEGIQRQLDITDPLKRTLKNMDGVRVNNRNPLGTFDRFSRLTNADDTSLGAIDDWNFSINIGSNRGFVLIDWWTGTMWLLLYYDTNKDFEQIRDSINDPSSTVDYESATDSRIKAASGLVYGFDDWKVPTYNHINTLWDYVRGVQPSISDDIIVFALYFVTSTIRVDKNYQFRFDSNGAAIDSQPITLGNRRQLICRRILESDY